MSVNGITNSTSTYAASAYQQTKTASKQTTENGTSDSRVNKSALSGGVVYQSSMSESDRAALVEQLKADSQARMDSFKSMVTDMLTQQGFAVKNSDDIWKMLASGNFTVDENTAAKAKEAISENGYWGVNQTSERIFEMAKAFAGDDLDKLEEMMEAFDKGFSQAEKMWGGKLPDISQKTYDAVYEKYQAYKDSLTTEA